MIRLFLALTMSSLLLTSLTLASNVTEIGESDLMFEKATKAVKAGRYKEAIEIFEVLAENYEADAQYNFALLLKSGRGRPQNYASSLKWGWLALLGNIEAAEELVDEIKKIIPDVALKDIRNEVKAYIESRANAGNKVAISQMGDYFLKIPENPEYKDAYLWFVIASAFQIEDSISRRDKVQKELEGKDILQVQSKALEVFNNISETMR